MSKFGLYSNKSSSISFESHLEGLEEEETKKILIKLREFVKSIGNNVIEEIRPHRIVYAKSLTFRYFLDVQPRKDILIVALRKSRKEQSSEYTIKDIEEFENIKTLISEAYEKI
jgi:predicted transport protein